MKHFSIKNRLSRLCRISWYSRAAFVLIVLLFPYLSSAQVNPQVPATTSDHNKQVIGYLTQWGPWKDIPGLIPKGSQNQLNVDYSQYTILNFSFFGVAVDGSIHSGDYRNRNIYQDGVVQQPAPLINEDIYSSWDKFILYGELEVLYHISDGSPAYNQGYRNANGGWTNIETGESGAFPLSIHKEGGPKGMLALCKENGVKAMASIGGWSMCKHFPEMAADPAKRARFIEDCKKLIALGFDGIDLDWEYPGHEGMNFTGTPADFTNFAILVEEIRAAIGPDKLITSCFSANPAKLVGFDWSRIDQSMDYYNIMTYDFNGGWSNIAGHNAPLYDYSGAEYANFSIDAAAQAMKATNIPLNKINIGMAFYGRGVVTNGPAALNAPTVKVQTTIEPDGPVMTAADFTNWAKNVWDGTPNYNAVVANTGDWEEHWDDEAKVPYKTKGNFFLSYDNERSITEKAKYINQEQLGGVIVWHVSGDWMDLASNTTTYGGKLVYSPNTKAPLINTINKVFADGNTGNRKPTVTLLSPEENTAYPSGSPVTIEASASDSDGTVSKVEFLVNGSIVGTDTSSPYNFTVTDLADGSYSISARATDNEGATATSASVNIKIGDSTNNIAPMVSITSPANNSIIKEGSAINIIASASDSDGSIVGVKFFIDGSLAGEATNSPYTYVWNNVKAGNYTLTAIATDNEGASTTSEAVMVKIEENSGSECNIPTWESAKVYNGGDRVSYNGNIYEAKWWTQGENPAQSAEYGVWALIGPCGNGNQAPTVSLTSPANNATYKKGATVNITASANDSDGTISKVEFFNGTTKLGEDTTAPYSYSWTNVVEGNYSLTARATDNKDAVTTSEAINIKVESDVIVDPDPCVGGKRIVGYMPSWSGTAQAIQYNKLTHIMYSFIRPTTTGGLTAVEDPQKLRDIVTLAHQNGVKVAIAVGGWSDLNNTDFETMAANATYRQNFINNLLSLIDNYDLDGVDMDWEYPAGGQNPANFATLMHEMAVALHARGKELSAAVAAYGYNADAVVNSVFNDVDFLNLMAYDGGNGSAHSPYNYAELTMNYWLGRGLPANKAILGVPFYGRPTWKSYKTLLAEGADPYADVFNGVYYNGINTIKAKAELGAQQGGGIMIWEISQDTEGQYSLLSAINEVIKPCGGGGTGLTVSITSPSPDANFASGSSVTISANASDSDGSVIKVAFYAGQNLIVEDATAPYSANWTPMADGAYELRAVATDNEGNTSSASVKITVGNVSCSEPEWSASAIYTQGMKVSYEGNTYEAKWWTQGENPTQTGEWGVWNLLGACSFGSMSAESDANTMKSQSLESDLQIFPNPSPAGSVAKLRFKDNIQEAKVYIHSMEGGISYSETLNSEDGIAELKIPALPSGLYVIKVVAGNKVWSLNHLIK
ncbi:glycosyl hydrolase family 18 protein [Marinigracilibium pacificum]|uniref:chitinase n=1 Tax=Marinigracilibium pacificum TaxID=2729599 RepID=A0A848J1E9_9BACT|nr:glycosyl hydrolase family 18 protein [Marinigracilibium pacificum]NMM48129.1 T9SS type A sorting domain-containing protein [Marinigracilibium pacificum]